MYVSYRTYQDFLEKLMKISDQADEEIAIYLSGKVDEMCQ